MAAPITHIALTQKVYSQFFSSINKLDFYVGTSFPDIRYLGIIDRSRTHYSNPTISSIQNADPFTAGVIFHSMVDETREKFYQDHNLYSLIPQSPYSTQAVKLYEDILLYNQVNNWSEIANYFSQILPGELAYDLQSTDIKRWHELLLGYFLEGPNSSRLKSYVDLLSNGRPQPYQEIIKLLSIIKTVPKLRQKIEEMYTNFANLLIN